MLSSRILRDGGYKFSSKVYSILVGIQDFGLILNSSDWTSQYYQKREECRTPNVTNGKCKRKVTCQSRD